MKIIITEHQFDEVVTKQKTTIGQGIYHKVYGSKTNPNIVYKVGEHETVQEAYHYFTNYPYLFPKVYDFKKLRNKKNEFGNDIYYLTLEKLDIQKFIDFWYEINEIIKNKFNTKFQSIVYDFHDSSDVWIEVLDYLEEFDYKLFKDTHEFYLLLNELNDIYDFPDMHNGQFGYDKEGTLKCLDF